MNLKDYIAPMLSGIVFLIIAEQKILAIHWFDNLTKYKGLKR